MLYFCITFYVCCLLIVYHTFDVIFLYITVCAQNVRSSANESAYMLTPLDIITFSNHVMQSGPLAVDASCQFVDIRDLGMLDLLLINVKEVTDFQ